MADSEVLKRCLNPVILNLQKMELELKCPTCLNLLDQPIMLPCSHIFCSHCISILTKSGCECSSCKSSFIHQDLRPAGHINTLVNIYKDMKSAVAANLPHKKSKDENFDKKRPASESPVSGNNIAKEIPQKELVHNMAGQKLSHPQLQTLNTLTPIEGKSNEFATEGKSNEFATERSKKQMQSLGEEALVDKGEQYSPPSFGSIKDSDCDNSNNGNEHQIKRSLLMVKESEVGSKEMKELDAGKSKRQKLNIECDVGDKGEISARGFTTPSPDCEHNRSSCSDTHPLDTSRYLSANRIVECAFCHSFRTTEGSGKMLHFLDGKEVDLDQAKQTNAVHVHEKCIEWAPKTYFSGETIKNLEVELSRASKIKCTSCGLRGAALGCYVKSCRRSYHVPCAYEILECRWDCDNYLVLCPAHSSCKLPCDRFKRKSKSKNKAKHSLDSSDPSGDLTSPVTPGQGYLMSPGWDTDWIFCGSALSKEEKGVLDKFACTSEAVVTNLWKSNVTHVIASVDENGGCSRTLKVLMAILTGKWILSIEWVKACIEAGHHVPEEPYEVTHDVHGVFDGPKIGRIRATEKAPKLFNGFSFYVTDDFQQACFKTYLEDLIVTGGGTLLKKIDLMHIQGGRNDPTPIEQANGEEICPKVIIVFSSEPPLGDDSRDIEEVLKQRSAGAEALAADVCGQAIRHTTLLDNIAACHFEMS